MTIEPRDHAMPVEEDFARQISMIANGWPRCENAIASARELAYAVLDPDADLRVVQAVATNWLERFGRSEIREARMSRYAS